MRALDDECGIVDEELRTPAGWWQTCWCGQFYRVDENRPETQAQCHGCNYRTVASIAYGLPPTRRKIERMAGIIGEQEVTIADLKYQLAKAMQSTVEASELGNDLITIATFQVGRARRIS